MTSATDELPAQSGGEHEEQIEEALETAIGEVLARFSETPFYLRDWALVAEGSRTDGPVHKHFYNCPSWRAHGLLLPLQEAIKIEVNIQQFGFDEDDDDD